MKSLNGVFCLTVLVGLTGSVRGEEPLPFKAVMIRHNEWAEKYRAAGNALAKEDIKAAWWADMKKLLAKREVSFQGKFLRVREYTGKPQKDVLGRFSLGFQYQGDKEMEKWTMGGLLCWTNDRKLAANFNAGDVVVVVGKPLPWGNKVVGDPIVNQLNGFQGLQMVEWRIPK